MKQTEALIVCFFVFWVMLSYNPHIGQITILLHDDFENYSVGETPNLLEPIDVVQSPLSRPLVVVDDNGDKVLGGWDDIVAGGGYNIGNHSNITMVLVINFTGIGSAFDIRSSDASGTNAIGSGVQYPCNNISQKRGYAGIFVARNHNLTDWNCLVSKRITYDGLALRKHEWWIAASTNNGLTRTRIWINRTLVIDDTEKGLPESGEWIHFSLSGGINCCKSFISEITIYNDSISPADLRFHNLFIGSPQYK